MHAFPPRPTTTWVVVVPLKGLGLAKSRLAPLGDPTRRALALAMGTDAVQACADAVGADHVLVVTDDPTIGDRMARLGARVVADAGGGLNEAVRQGARAARELVPDGAVAAVVGDLPCLSAADLRAVLLAAADVPRAYVPDADGTGTVLITAAPGVDLLPRFGPGSAARHGEVAAKLPAPAAVRLDVDDPPAWRRALAAGPGPRSRQVDAGT